MKGIVPRRVAQRPAKLVPAFSPNRIRNSVVGSVFLDQSCTFLVGKVLACRVSYSCLRSMRRVHSQCLRMKRVPPRIVFLDQNRKRDIVYTRMSTGVSGRFHQVFVLTKRMSPQGGEWALASPKLFAFVASTWTSWWLGWYI